jgi:hypothetical protein
MKISPDHPHDALGLFRYQLVGARRLVQGIVDSPSETEEQDLVAAAVCLDRVLDDFDALRQEVTDWFRKNAPELGLLGEESRRAAAKKAGAA